MKRIINLALATSLLVTPLGCQKTNNTVQNQEQPAQDQNVDYTTGSPWLDNDLEGNVTKDTKTNLKENFSLYVNKDRLLDLEIPEGHASAGTVYDIAVLNEADMKAMFENSEGQSHDAQLANTLYNLLMDWDSRNQVGVAPLKEQVDTVEALDSVDALTDYIANTPAEKQLYTLWSADIGTNLDDSNQYILSVSPNELLMDDSAEYKELTEYGKVVKEARVKLMKKMLVKLGYSKKEADKKIENCLSFEKKLSTSIYSSEDQQKPDYLEKINNHYSRDDVVALQDKLPILDYFEKAQGYPASEDYEINEPAFVKKLNKLYTDDNLTLIKDYLIVHGALKQADFLDKECYDWSMEADNTIAGITGSLDEESVFARITSEQLPWPTSRLYSETYLKPEDKERITQIVEEIKVEYHDIINNADFLSDETRAKAIEKLDALEANVLYPDSWDLYSCDDLNLVSSQEGGTLWDALETIEAYNTERHIKDYAGPINKEKWQAPPFVVNCAYSGTTNKMYILGAFTQGDIYNSEMSDEEVYAKIGMVIGHEISHAFDSTGAQFDKDGNMANWWTDQDLEAFKKKNEKMAEYFTNMHPWEGQNFKGSIMTGEACADMAGMKCMLQIASKKEHFDYDTFFRSYADLWCVKDSLQQQYVKLNDVHPMAYLRVNATLQQYDEFLDFYEIKEGDKMYLAKEDRVNIW